MRICVYKAQHVYLYIYMSIPDLLNSSTSVSLAASKTGLKSFAVSRASAGVFGRANLRGLKLEEHVKASGKVYSKHLAWGYTTTC